MNKVSSGVWNRIKRAEFPIASFGVDEKNEMYICGFDGRIYRFVFE
ncbi:hypothetical protein [Pararhodonellum marinum]|nr:hypothetical protein [Pararhodonellum marinum]